MVCTTDTCVTKMSLQPAPLPVPPRHWIEVMASHTPTVFSCVTLTLVVGFFGASCLEWYYRSTLTTETRQILYIIVPLFGFFLVQYKWVLFSVVPVLVGWAVYYPAYTSAPVFKSRDSDPDLIRHVVYFASMAFGVAVAAEAARGLWRRRPRPSTPVVWKRPPDGAERLWGTRIRKTRAISVN